MKCDTLNANPPYRHKGIWTLLGELFGQLSLRRRRQFVLFLCLMFLGAIAELVSIGAILPFLAVISNPERMVQQAQSHTSLATFGITTSSQITILVAVMFALAALFAASTRLFLVYFSQRFVFGLSRDLSVAVFSRTLHQPYSYHISQNSTETLAAITKAQLVTEQVLIPLVQAATASLIAAAILIGLLFIDPLMAMGSGICFASTYLIVMRMTRAVMLANGKIIAQMQGERLRAASEGIGGIRDVLLDSSQAVFVARFAAIEAKLGSAAALNNFIGQSPRFIVEGIGLVIVAGLAVVLSLRDGGLAIALPLLGALALGAQRLLPLLQQAYYGWAGTLTAGSMLADILDILRLPDAQLHFRPRDHDRLSFERDLEFSKVVLSYGHGTRPALECIDLLIPKGARIGLVGRTGSGKSTLMDLVLGLLRPDEGCILIDGVELTDANRTAWQARVTHVPQAIYLSDATIAENIAFGIPLPGIDRSRVAAAAAQAELTDVIAALPNGYDTFVGERGVRLSGGQRQRVGIARALYKQADVLVFDEATSALDTETEAAVMHAIEGLGRNLTIFIIAHRVSTLSGCDMIVTLDEGRVSSGKYTHS
jgi:ABC-type multidrug transport system fused ATPase/permease subunit